jgi:hypothetical protein
MWVVRLGFLDHFQRYFPASFHWGSIQIISKPRAFNAALYACQFIVRYICGAAFMHLERFILTGPNPHGGYSARIHRKGIDQVIPMPGLHESRVALSI